MAYATNARLNEDDWPAPQLDLGQLQKASPPEAIEIAKTLPEGQRACLAAFCYNKRHLHALALMIGSTCERDALVAACSVSGEAIYLQSRDPEKTLSKETHAGGARPPRPITLAGCGNESGD